MNFSRCEKVNLEVKKLIAHGWIYRRGSKHGKVYCPDRRFFVVVPGTPSDKRTGFNFVRDVRRMQRMVKENEVAVS